LQAATINLQEVRASLQEHKPKEISMPHKRKVLLRISLLIIVVALAGCGHLTPPLTSTPTAIPSFTTTPTILPTLTPSVTPSPTPVPRGALLAYVHSEAGINTIFTVDVDYGTEQKLTSEKEDVEFFNWSPDGIKLIYQISQINENELYTVEWDGSEREKILSGSTNGSYPVWSPDGNKIAIFSPRLGHWALFTMNPDGRGHTALTDNTVFPSLASWSPDSSQIAFNPWHNTMTPPFIAKVNVDGSGYTELTSGEGDDYDPVWSPQGDIILFSSWRSGSLQIYRMNADGTEQQALTSSMGGNSNPVWSPDGRQIVFVSWRDSDNPEECRDSECNFEIYTMNADGSNQTRITDHTSEDWGGVWSPDGKKIAFQSLRDEPTDPFICGEDCNSEIYVMNVDGSDVIRLTNNDTPDWGPSWRP
jgi:Tol biopolymer transport system component